MKRRTLVVFRGRDAENLVQLLSLHDFFSQSRGASFSSTGLRAVSNSIFLVVLPPASHQADRCG
jgi:hypothetical protein